MSNKPICANCVWCSKRGEPAAWQCLYGIPEDRDLVTGELIGVGYYCWELRSKEDVCPIVVNKTYLE